jgi:APA family basic amino acid/polyamine antiporter
MSGLISVGLISAVSAMTWAGPRVTRVMGEDRRGLGWLARSSDSGVPWAAILCQTGLAYLFLLTSTFEAVLVYVELLVLLSAFLTVAGLFVLRMNEWHHYWIKYKPSFLPICIPLLIVRSKTTTSR